MNRFNMRSEIAFVGKHPVTLVTIKADILVLGLDVIFQLIWGIRCEVTFITLQFLRPMTVDEVLLQMAQFIRLIFALIAKIFIKFHIISLRVLMSFLYMIAKT